MTAQLRLDMDTTRIVELDDVQAHAVAGMLRAGAAALEEIPVAMTDGVEINSRARLCALARRVAAELLGHIPDELVS